VKTRSIQIHLVPDLLAGVDLSNRAAIVIDVLRATTTIVHALAAGAERIVPCLDIDQARSIADQSPNPLLGGERGGRKIAGFDLGNSPREYRADLIAGRTVVFTTTNGTKAMEACRGANRIYIAAFVNLAAVCREASEHEALEIVCAGTNGQITREDVLLAGAIVDLLQATSGHAIELNDQGHIAVDAWRHAQTALTSISLADRLKASQGGRNVLQIGLENDIEIAAEIDKFDIAPILDTQSWEIRLAD